MGKITWNSVEKVYENGVDQGVLYPHNAPAVAWVGLTNATEKPAKDTLVPQYYQGEKYDIISRPGERTTSISAYTYPDEFDHLTRLTTRDPYGIAYGEQPSGFFSMSYRTMYSDGSYKITVLFNQKAVPGEFVFNTIGGDNAATLFTWELQGVPIRFSDKISTTYVVFDSKRVDAAAMKELETFLYGDETHDPSIVGLINLIKVAAERHGKYVIDINQNGEFTLRGPDKLLTTSHDKLEFTAAEIDALVDTTNGQYTANDGRV